MGRKEALFKAAIAALSLKEAIPALRDKIRLGDAVEGDPDILEILAYGDLAWGAHEVASAQLIFVDRGYYSDHSITFTDMVSFFHEYFDGDETLLHYLSDLEI